MKKLLLALGLLLFVFFSFAQNSRSGNHPITIGLIGGVNNTYLNVTAPYNEYVYSNHAMPFSLGVNADFKFNDFISLRTAFFYSAKGGVVGGPYANIQGDNYVESSYKLNYFEVPVNFIGHLPVSERASLFLGVGPYFSIGLSGTNTQTVSQNVQTASTIKRTQKITFGSDGDFKSTDSGASFVFGFQGETGWTVNVNFDYGLKNILQNNNLGVGASGAKTVAFYLGIGQRF